MNTSTKDPAIVATAIERAGITLLRDRLGNYYTIEPRKGLAYLSAERFTTWLPQHTGVELAHNSVATARSILASAELAAISTPSDPVLPLTASQLEDLARCIASKIQH